MIRLSMTIECPSPDPEIPHETHTVRVVTSKARGPAVLIVVDESFSGSEFTDDIADVLTITGGALRTSTDLT